MMWKEGEIKFVMILVAITCGITVGGLIFKLIRGLMILFPEMRLL